MNSNDPKFVILLVVPIVIGLLSGCAINQQGAQHRGWNGQGVFSKNRTRSNLMLADARRQADATLQMPQVEIALDEYDEVNEDPISANAMVELSSGPDSEIAFVNSTSKSMVVKQEGQPIVRAQDPGYGYGPPVTLGSPQPNEGQYIQPYEQNPLFPGTTTVPRTGSPNEAPQGVFPYAPVGNYTTPGITDIDVILNEAQTGRITFGAAFNSDSGIVGQIIVDERNFDIMRFPRSFGEIVDGTAWRGAGQGFRMELVPGSQVQRYLVSFTEPYLFNTDVSFSASGYLFDRRFFDWDEQRLGGRLALGYNLTPELSVSVGVRMEDVNIRNPRVNTSPALNSVVGDSDLYVGNVSLTHDTRNHPFMASEGHYMQLSYHQGFGDFDFPRGDLDYRRYFLIYERPDFSGRHTLSLGTRLGFSGSNTPVYENYFAGGFSTMRGFDFRGASPVQGDVRIGGQFQWLNTIEYTFPITADDMIKGVLFTDFGTVEENITINSNNFRVAPGFGFRIHLPMGGAGGAPLAFDFAFPVAKASTDDTQIFSFYLGVLR